MWPLTCSCEECVVSVCDCGHGVDFEVLVWSNLRYTFDWSPVCEWRLGIIEPLVAQVLQVIVINVSNSLGDFASSDSSVQVQDLRSNFLDNVWWCFSSEESVVQWVSASVDFYIIQVVRVDGWETHTTVVHVSCEHFITVEVVTPNTWIRVGVVKWFLSGDIRKITQ